MVPQLGDQIVSTRLDSQGPRFVLLPQLPLDLTRRRNRGVAARRAPVGVVGFYGARGGAVHAVDISFDVDVWIAAKPAVAPGDRRRVRARHHTAIAAEDRACDGDGRHPDRKCGACTCRGGAAGRRRKCDVSRETVTRKRLTPLQRTLTALCELWVPYMI